MTIAEKIFATWTASASAIALVPASRFKLSGVYQNLAFPYVIYHPITSERFRTIDGGVAGSIERDTWQFSIHCSGAAAASTADTIRLKLIEVLDGNKGGFNFHYRSTGPLIQSEDFQYVMRPVDFLVTSA